MGDGKGTLSGDGAVTQLLKGRSRTGLAEQAGKMREPWPGSAPKDRGSADTRTYGAGGPEA